MERTQLTPHEFSKVIFESGHNGLTSVYPDLLFSAEQQENLIQFVVESGDIRQVVKIDKEFKAVSGRYETHQRVDADLIVTLPQGYYPTESKALIGRCSNRYLYGEDGTIYTIVNDRVKPYCCPDEGFIDAYFPGDISVTRLRLSEVLLYGPDVKQYLGGIGQTTPFEQSRVTTIYTEIKDRKATADDLMEVTGTHSLEDAIDVATSLIEQLEAEHSILDNSCVMSVFRSVLRQVQSGSLTFKNITQAEKYLNIEHGFNTRQANVFAQELFKQITD
ncbi:TPA: hypothetical protein NKZ56_002172 [Vibrio parahaemolyticus]|nr:hypothetical protein [Vibrio parahaemolyticus]